MPRSFNIINVLGIAARLCVALLVFLMTANALAAPTYLDFARLPDVNQLTLSPEGHKLAAFVRVDLEGSQGTAVQVTDLATNKKKMVLFTDNSKYFLYDLYWKDERTLLVHTYYPANRDTWIGFAQVRGKTRETRLLVIDTERDTVKTPFKESFLKRFMVMPSHLGWVVDTLPDEPKHILMALPDFRGGAYNVIYKVNIARQSTKLYQDDKAGIDEWLLDGSGRVRGGYRFDKGEASVRLQSVTTGKWHNLWPSEAFSEEAVEVLGFDEDPDTVWVRANHEGRGAIFTADLRQPEAPLKLQHAGSEYDLSGHLVYAPDSHKVIGISSSENGGSLFFEPDLKALQASIDRGLPGTTNYIYAISNDRQRYLVFSTSPTDSGTYYLGDRKAGKLDAVAHRYNQLAPDQLSPVERFNYTARDGLAIEGWLTRPRHHKAGERVPAG